MEEISSKKVKVDAKILSLEETQLLTNAKLYQEGKRKELDKANESVKKLK